MSLPIRWSRTFLVVLTAALAVLPAVSRLSAQQRDSLDWCGPAVDGRGRVRGVIYDSVTHQPLSGMRVGLAPLNGRDEPMNSGKWIGNDSLGRFCFDLGIGMPPGRYRLTGMYLSTLGHRRPAPIHRDVRVDSGVSTTISVPYRSLPALDSIATKSERDSLLAVLRDQRRKWSARRPYRYYFQAVPNCLCASPRIRVIVEGDSSVGTVEPETKVERISSSSRSLGTMEQVFDWLERDVRNPRNLYWKVKWDERYGFPTEWDANAGVVIVDVYTGYSVTHFQASRQ